MYPLLLHMYSLKRKWRENDDDLRCRFQNFPQKVQNTSNQDFNHLSSRVRKNTKAKELARKSSNEPEIPHGYNIFCRYFWVFLEVNSLFWDMLKNLEYSSAELIYSFQQVLLSFEICPKDNDNGLTNNLARKWQKYS